jgi:hypothetical protein
VTGRTSLRHNLDRVAAEAGARQRQMPVRSDGASEGQAPERTFSLFAD